MTEQVSHRNLNETEALPKCCPVITHCHDAKAQKVQMMNFPIKITKLKVFSNFIRANDTFPLSSHFQQFLKNPSEYICFILGWANLMLHPKISRWSQQSVARGTSGSRLMWASFYFFTSTLPWNAYPRLHPVQSIQIEIINASWLLTHFFRRLDTFWEAEACSDFHKLPAAWRQNMIQHGTVQKPLPHKAQDIQKCIHRCARYPKIYPLMRKICNAASKFWLHQMQRAVLHQPQGREAGAWQEGKYLQF